VVEPKSEGGQGVEIELPEVAISHVVAFGLVLGRLAGIFLLAPVFSARALPVTARVAVAFALAVALTPLATRGQQVPTELLDVALLLLKEALVGVGFAFALSAVVAGVQFAAGLLDTVIGFSYVSIIDPFSQIQGGIIGQLYGLFVAVVITVTGGLQLMVMGLAGTYGVIPLSSTPSYATLGELALDGFARVFVLGLEVAAPVLIAIVVVDAALALVARAAPQLNVFVVGLPAKILVGVAVVSASLPFVASHVQAALESAVLDGLRTLGG
jgi:flagellar biosynthetic protein FliR